MSYKLKTTKEFDKVLKKLDRSAQRLILSYLKKNIDGTDNPRARGKGLVGNYSGLWRYRIADYRVLCDIRETELIVIAIDVGHRKEIYKHP